MSSGSNVVVNTSFGDDNIRITTADANLTIGISEISHAGLYECYVEEFGSNAVNLTIYSKNALHRFDS